MKYLIDCVCVWQSVCTSPHYAVNLKARPTHTTFALMTSSSTKSKSKSECVCVCVRSCQSSGNVSSVSPASTQTLVLWTSPCCLGTAANSTRSSRWGSAAAAAAALQLRLPSHQTRCPIRFHCDGLTTFTTDFSGSAFWSSQSASHCSCQSGVTAIWHQCSTAKYYTNYTTVTATQHCVSILSIANIVLAVWQNLCLMMKLHHVFM